MSDGPAQRRLILFMSMSLDGFAARRDGTMDWLSEQQHHSAHRQRAVSELLGQAGLLVLGRRAAQEMAAAWPSSTSPTGTLMNALPKVVFSRSITHLEWENARISPRPVQDEVAELKRQPGRDLVAFGGASFARALTAHHLVDEHRITVQPVVLGDGLPLLHGLQAPQPLELVSTTTWADGPVTHTYVPRRERAGSNA